MCPLRSSVVDRSSGRVSPLLRRSELVLIAEWPALPVVPNLYPNAEQSERLEDQEDNDQHAEQNDVPIENSQCPTRTDVRSGDRSEVTGALGQQEIGNAAPDSALLLPQELGDLLDHLRENDHEERSGQGSTYCSGTADQQNRDELDGEKEVCLLYTSPSPRDKRQSRMPSSA